MVQCPFCLLDESRVLLENEFAAAVADLYPVAPGHTLVIPKRHVSSLFVRPIPRRAIGRLAAGGYQLGSYR
jgi:diadenosine tetraphosphate (Ap4A) HIT family hydrolase